MTGRCGLRRGTRKWRQDLRGGEGGAGTMAGPAFSAGLGLHRGEGGGWGGPPPQRPPRGGGKCRPGPQAEPDGPCGGGIAAHGGSGGRSMSR